MPKLIALALVAFRVAAAAPPTSSDEKMIEDLTMPRKRAVRPETRCAPRNALAVFHRLVEGQGAFRTGRCHTRRRPTFCARGGPRQHCQPVQDHLDVTEFCAFAAKGNSRCATGCLRP
jgi:hypothetical protein